MHTILYNSLNCHQYRHNSVQSVNMDTWKHTIILHYYSIFLCGVSGEVVFLTFLQLIWGKTTNKIRILFGKFVWNWAKNVPSALFLGVIGRKMAYIRPLYNMHKWVTGYIFVKIEKFRAIIGAILCKMTKIIVWQFGEIVQKYLYNSLNCVHN